MEKTMYQTIVDDPDTLLELVRAVYLAGYNMGECGDLAIEMWDFVEEGLHRPGVCLDEFINDYIK